MSLPYLPTFFQGDSQEVVDKALGKAVKAIARGIPVAEVLQPVPSLDSQRSSVPVYLSRVASGSGFHVSGLLPQVYDTWMARSLKLDDQAFALAVDQATGIYADFLSHPWGVLGALTYDAFIWLKPGFSPDEEFDRGRVSMFLQALKREEAWLRSLDGRFAGPLTEKPNHPWQVHNLLTFLTAHHGLSMPNSWSAWATTMDALIRIYQ